MYYYSSIKETLPSKIHLKRKQSMNIFQMMLLYQPILSISNLFIFDEQKTIIRRMNMFNGLIRRMEDNFHPIRQKMKRYFDLFLLLVATQRWLNRHLL